MSTWKYEDVDRVKIGGLYLPSEQITVFNYKAPKKHCLAWYYEESNDTEYNVYDATYHIKDFTRRVYANETIGRIWVSPDCRISRDVLRNCGYQLVRSKETADRIVVPEVIGKYGSICFGVLAKPMDPDRSELYALNIYQYGKLLSDSNKYAADETRENIKRVLAHYSLVPLQFQLYNLGRLTFIPDYEIYKDVLNCWTYNNKFISETALLVNTPLTISPQTLELWERMPDDMLEKAICSSNWTDYPFTLFNFLCKNGNYNVINNGKSENIKLVRDYIERAQKLPVSPDDWNMYQRYLLYKNGLGEDGGFISLDRTSMKSKYGLLRCKLAVKPLFVDKPVPWNYGQV